MKFFHPSPAGAEPVVHMLPALRRRTTAIPTCRLPEVTWMERWCCCGSGVSLTMISYSESAPAASARHGAPPARALTDGLRRLPFTLVACVCLSHWLPVLAFLAGCLCVPFSLGPLGAYWEGLGRLADLALLNFIIAVSALAWSFRIGCSIGVPGHRVLFTRCSERDGPGLRPSLALMVRRGGSRGTHISGQQRHSHEWAAEALTSVGSRGTHISARAACSHPSECW